MCELTTGSRPHFRLRPQSRSARVAGRPDNRVDVVIGNPPWLAYRHMTPVMQAAFRAMSAERGYGPTSPSLPTRTYQAYFSYAAPSSTCVTAIALVW
jgi:hypothetical protein